MTALWFAWLTTTTALVPADSSGPKTGERLAPYMSIVSVGPNRGQLHCFV